jgi:DNA polymerase-3 subunit beta
MLPVDDRRRAMKVRLRRELFLQGCRLAERGLPQRPAGSRLGRLLLQAQDDTCTLHAVGSDVGLRLDVPAVVEEPGEALVAARHALAIVREAAADELTLESSPGRVRARGEDAEFLLEVPPQGRPLALGPFPEGACHLIPADALRQAIRRTLFAVGQRTSRYGLHGVLWEVGPDEVRLVATDNLRLAVAEVPAQATAESATSEPLPERRLLPARAVDLLARLTEQQQEPVRALFGERHTHFRAGRATLCARHIEGDFPDWRRVAPPRPRHLLPLPVGPFLAGVRQASALREDEGARLLLRFEPGWVLMESRQAGAGRARVHLPLPLAGGRVEVAFEPRFLVELLRAFDADSTLLLGLTDASTPAVFSDGESCTHVIMPLRRR